MHARVAVWTIDGEPLESLVVENPAEVGEWIRVLAGPQGAAGEESFDLLVCTPTWLAREVAESGPQVGRHRLIIDTWNAANVKRVVAEFFEREVADDWLGLAPKLARIGHWEFEDYGEGKPRTQRR